MIRGKILGVKVLSNGDKFILTEEYSQLVLFSITKGSTWTHEEAVISKESISLILDLLENNYLNFSLDEFENNSRPNLMEK